jgi:hypothetical protein
MTREERRETEVGYIGRMQSMAELDGWKLPGMKEAA